VHISQPAVSKSLAEIERLLDVQLFLRGARGLTPTVYGECIVRHARALLSGLRQARDELLSLRSGGSGTVTIAMLPAAAALLVPRAICILKKRAPSTVVVLREGTWSDMLPELRTEKLDLIVGTMPRWRNEQGLATRILVEEDSIVVVTGVHHPLAAGKATGWAELAGYPWIIPPASASLRAPLEEFLGQQGLELPLDRVESVSFIANKALLQTTDAIAFMTRDIARNHAESGLLAVLPLEVPGLVGPVGAMWLKNRELSPAAEGMLNALSEAGRGGLGEGSGRD
jgi:DNA-binding transcriptional LysR family regulator